MRKGPGARAPVDDAFTTNEEAQRSVRWIAIAFLAIGWGLAWWVWPSGVADAPLASITVRDALWMLASGVLGLATLYGFWLLWVE
jgi:hypothetical protein